MDLLDHVQIAAAIGGILIIRDLLQAQTRHRVHFARQGTQPGLHLVPGARSSLAGPVSTGSALTSTTGVGGGVAPVAQSQARAKPRSEASADVPARRITCSNLSRAKSSAPEPASVSSSVAEMTVPHSLTSASRSKATT